MHPRHALKCVLETRRRFGLQAALLEALERMVNTVMFVQCLHVIALRRDAVAATAQRPVNLRTQLADEPTLQAMHDEGGWEIDDVKLAQHRAGDACVLSLVDGEPAGCTWVHTRGQPTLRLGLTLQLPTGALYNYAGFTRPAFRGHGLQAWRHRALLDEPAWAGHDTVWGYVRATNFASQRGQARSGYRRVGSLWLLGTPRRFAVWLSPALRAQGVRRVRDGVDTQAVDGNHPPGRPA